MPRLFGIPVRHLPARGVLRLFLSVSLFAALGALAPNAPAGATAPVVNRDGSLSLNSGFSGALNLSGWQVTLDSRRGPILTRPEGPQPVSGPQSAAPASDPLGALAGVQQPSSIWLPLPHDGLTENPVGPVYALAVSGSDVYVGGYFTETADGAVTDLNNIARFNTNTDTWSALPHEGLDNTVFALAISGTDLYAGGNFGLTADGAVTLTSVARFSGGAWSRLPNMGLNGPVYALAVMGSSLYVGGGFNKTNDCTFSLPACVNDLNGIARFSGAAWSALPNKGLWGGNVHAFAVSGGTLYVGGGFYETADCTFSLPACVPNLNKIARFSAGAWSALPHNGLNGPMNAPVHALAMSGSTLYVGGTFTATFDGAVANLNNIARFSGGAWSALPHNGVDNEVRALAVSGNDLYLGGIFGQTGDGAVGNLNAIAHFSTISNTWSAPPEAGLNALVYALAFQGNSLYVGGSFGRTFNGAVLNLNNIAKLTNDTDGDGIPDDWESSGVTINGVFINLPAMGANPLHKDVFVHADWMDHPGLKPEARDLKIVSDAFDRSPLPNPDGKTGVHLHIDLGADSIMDPVKGTTWGALAVAQALPYQAALGSIAGNGYNWTAFDALKQVDFNGSQRAAVFHYMCFCNTIGGLGATSGLSRGAPAHDFMVTLGGWHVVGGTSLQKAGTFMHELGHNLGLDHGGADGINFKPNYLSVMNYSFQTTGVLKESDLKLVRAIDYSRSQLATLDETALDEIAGINDPADHLTVWNTKQLNGACAAHPNNFFVAFLNPGVDWDCDGVQALSDVAADVNGDGVCVGPGVNGVSDTAPAGDDLLINDGHIIAGANRKCETARSGDDVQTQPVNFQQPNLLSGFDDWSALAFNAGGQIGQPPAVLDTPSPLAPSDVLTTTVDEPTFQQISDALPPALFNAEASAPIDVVSYAPASGAAPLRVVFDGSASTTPTGTVTSWVWNFGDSITGTGALITHTYALPGTYYATLRVTNSGGNVNLVALDQRVTVSNLAKVFLPFMRR